MSSDIELRPTRSTRSDRAPLFEPSEPVPMTIFYDEEVKYTRPTIRELRTGTVPIAGETFREQTDAPKVKGAQFGMWEGVFARSLLSTFGVVMFLRIGWLTGQAGVGLASLIVLLCSFLTGITALSLSAICTNGEIKGGGAYYLISRSLGPEFGGAIGILFFFANALGVSLYLVGFSESVATLLQQEQDFELTSGGEWDETVYGLCSLMVMMFFTLFGIEALLKIQVLLLVMILVSVASVVVGSFICCSDTNEENGFLGYGQLSDNFGPHYTGDETFFTVLAVFFPAVTGMMAGTNISGELKDAQQSIPTGTLLSIVAASVTYLVLVFVTGSTSARGGGEYDPSDYGLLGNYLIMADISAWEPLLLVGIFSASLSSAMATLDGAPRILQAVAKDKIFPYFEWFAEGYGPNQEPARGYAFTCLIAAISITAGNLNSIATIITNFYLISYAFINYACFAASVTKAPGWRPSFVYYNKWVALAGSIVCIFAMFLIDWIAALVTFGCFLAIYKYVDFVKPQVNWGSATQAKVYLDALTNLANLATLSPHVKTFRPQIIVFVRDDEVEKSNIIFSARCSGGAGLTLCAKIVLTDSTNTESLRKVMESRDKLVLRDDVEDVYVFFHTIASNSIREGWKGVIQVSGIGKMRPNVVFFGFKENWNSMIVSEDESNRKLIEDYVSMIRDAFDLGFSVGIMRGIKLIDTTTPFSGRIDVYWLSDDGGLTVLIPHILQSSNQWKRTSLRVLSKCTDSNILLEEERMKTLLKRFRIRSSVKLLEGLDDQPSDDSIREYLSFGEKEYMEDALEIPKTKFILRLGELVKTESIDADLVVMYLPIPSENLDAHVYLSWLHILTKDLPQVLLLRGNQESVLTYYS